MGDMQVIEAWMRGQRRRILEVYQELHRRAELSWQEQETAAYLLAILKQQGIRTATFPDHHGIVAEVCGDGVGPVVAIRADMDALPLQTPEGQRPVHACGHDAHMTMVLFAGLCLQELGYRPPGMLKLVFQPPAPYAADLRIYPLHRQACR